jgi:hypothetical protein
MESQDREQGEEIKHFSPLAIGPRVDKQKLLWNVSSANQRGEVGKLSRSTHYYHTSTTCLRVRQLYHNLVRC